jgi:hypothetical protein
MAERRRGHGVGIVGVPHWRRRAALAGLVLLVLGAHALLLQRWAAPAVDAGGPAAPAVLELRLAEADLAAADPMPQAAAAPPAAADRPSAPLADAAMRPAAALAGTETSPPPVAATPSPLPAASPELTSPTSPTAGPELPMPPTTELAAAVQAEAPASDGEVLAQTVALGPAALAAARPAAVAATGSEWLPTYATLLPPSLRWRYRMRRGLLSGVAVFDWQRNDAGYRLSLDGSVAGLPVFEWTSTGGIDAQGVAPTRLVMRTVGRAARAANFQRDSGRITYSGHDAEHPLLPGTQDRVSWLVQLAGVVAAAPARFAAPPAQIAFQVSGVRGDLGVWRFDVVGEQAIDTPVGRVQALKLRREAERAFDTRGEIWLAAQHHHLPVRVVLSTIGREGQVVESLTLELEATR